MKSKKDCKNIYETKVFFLLHQDIKLTGKFKMIEIFSWISNRIISGHNLF